MAPSCRALRARLPSAARAFSTTSTPIIKENDTVLVRQQGEKYAKWTMTGPIQPGKTVKLTHGEVLKGEDLIGKRILDRLEDSKGRKSLVLHEPSLAAHILYSKRVATPIYPNDAATIVSLLELHPTRPGEDEDEGEPDTRTTASTPFEIFEAGTGMGSLTLHIARAIHAANPPTPPTLRSALMRSSFYKAPRSPSSSPSSSFPDSSDASSSSSSPSSSSTSSPAITDENIKGLEDSEITLLNTYRTTRRAIIHTIDNRLSHTTEAYKLIRNFRRAQYLPSIDFHTTSIQSFITTRLATTGNAPFLSRAILDLPGAHDNAAPVISALLPAGLLVIFAPSISQIAEFQKWSLESGQPIQLVQAVELPTSIVSSSAADTLGGRPWDVKMVRPRAESGRGEVDREREDRWVQILRPKVGDRVAGGGFVGLFRKVVVEAVTAGESFAETVESDVQEEEVSDSTASGSEESVRPE